MRQLLWIGIFFIFSCQGKPEAHLQFIEGYWEIVQVEKEGKIIKSFSINPDIDYFKINNNESGFRKKLKPRFDGSFETSRDTLKFDIEISENKLCLAYKIDILTLREHVEKASANRLIISNTEGFKYTYKPYEPLDPNNE